MHTAGGTGRSKRAGTAGHRIADKAGCRPRGGCTASACEPPTECSPKPGIRRTQTADRTESSESGIPESGPRPEISRTDREQARHEFRTPRRRSLRPGRHRPTRSGSHSCGAEPPHSAALSASSCARDFDLATSHTPAKTQTAATALAYPKESRPIATVKRTATTGCT